MGAILPIALNTFREARRNRVFYSLLFFAVGLILFSVLFTELTFVSQDRILRDVGFATIDVFGLTIAIFLGIGMVNREIEKRTLYTVISKPVPRWSFVLGKFVGLGLTLLATAGLMLVGFLLTLWSYRSPIDAVIGQAFLGLMVELAVVTAFAIFCSTWTSSTLSAFLTVSLFAIGHLASDIRFFGQKSESEWVRRGAELLYLVLPDLERFNFKPELAHFQTVGAHDFGRMLLYGALWTGVFLTAAVLLFRRRDFR